MVEPKSATLFEDDPKAPFSIATPPRCREGRYSFPWIAPLPLIPTLYCCVKQRGLEYHFLSIWYDSTWD